jgi:hypothetical protein
VLNRLFPLPCLDRCLTGVLDQVEEGEIAREQLPKTDEDAAQGRVIAVRDQTKLTRMKRRRLLAQQGQPIGRVAAEVRNQRRQVLTLPRLTK